MSTPPPLLSEGEIGLSSTATKDVLEHHGAAVLSGDIDAVVEDYATWTAEGVGFGTDTFIIRDGKIVVQTVAIFRVE